MIHIGIDPGANGCIWAWQPDGHGCVRLNGTEHDIASAFESMVTYDSGLRRPCRAAIERVGAMPKQGVSSTFRFGVSYGFLRGLLVALRVPFVEVAPGVWQRALGCLSGGNKNVTKAAAQRLWPLVTWTHALADAALIAEWLRRQDK
jgi:crossover junction endodeoxyribonuclease RuvC